MTAILEDHGKKQLNSNTGSTSITVPNEGGLVMLAGWRIRADSHIDTLTYNGDNFTILSNATGGAIRFIHARLFDPDPGTHNLIHNQTNGPYSNRQSLLWWIFSGINKVSENYGVTHNAARRFQITKTVPAGGVFTMCGLDRRNHHYEYPNLESGYDGTQIDRQYSTSGWFEGACINAYLIGDGTSKTMDFDHYLYIDWNDIWITYEPLSGTPQVITI